jgi:hypothetical protein
VKTSLFPGWKIGVSSLLWWGRSTAKCPSGETPDNSSTDREDPTATIQVTDIEFLQHEFPSNYNMSQASESGHNGFDIEKILQNATIAEKVSLLSGKTSCDCPILARQSVLTNTLSRQRFLAHRPFTQV